jgi:anti-sigma factor RsiW
MKCEWVKENIVLFVYDELPDDARYELEQHVRRCKNCAAELEGTRQFRASIVEPALDEPSPNLLAASRMKLQEALETAEQNGFWRRLMIDPAAWLQQMRFSPALAAMLLIAGFAGGIGATYKIVGGNAGSFSSAVAPSTQQPVESSISGIRSVTQQPGSNTTRFQLSKCRAHSMISAFSNCCSSPRATTTTPACAWIRWTYLPSNPTMFMSAKR